MYTNVLYTYIQMYYIYIYIYIINNWPCPTAPLSSVWSGLRHAALAGHVGPVGPRVAAVGKAARSVTRLACFCRRLADVLVPVSVNKKHFSGKEGPWEYQLEKHQIRGRRAVSGAGLQGKGAQRMSCFSETSARSVRKLRIRKLRIRKVRICESKFLWKSLWTQNVPPLRVQSLLESSPP